MTDPLPKVEGHDGLMWVRGSGACRDWNGIRYKLGIIPYARPDSDHRTRDRR